MTVPTQTVLELPRPGLGAAFGTGLQTGAQLGLQNLLKSFQIASNRKEQFEANKTKIIEGIDKIINTTFKNNQINPEDVGTETLRDLSKLAEQQVVETGNPLSALRVTQDYIDKQILDEGEDLATAVREGKSFAKEERKIRGKRGPIKGGRNFIDDLKRLEPQFTRGFTRESVAASLLGNQLTSEEVAEKAIEDPTFAQEMAEQVGTVAADLPFLAIGGSIGGVVGALTLPEFLRSAADEIWNLIRKDDKITLAEGGTAALKVAEKTAKGAVTGAILKRLPGLVPTLKRIPGAKKFLDNFMAEKLVDIGATAGTLATVPAALEERLPTARDFASALALTLGFETLAIPKTIRRNIEAKGEKSGLTPEAFSKKVETRAKEKDIDIEKVQAGEGKETQKFNRVINEISKEEAKPPIRKIERIVKEVEKPEIRREKLIEKEKETRLIAKRAAKSPVEAFSESIPAIKKPTKAQIFDQIDKSFEKIKTEIKKPELVDIKKVERRAELDNKAIDKANKILKRGELLSDIEQDTFLKIKNEYADAYQGMIDYNKGFIEDNKASPRSRLIRAVKEAEAMNKELSKRLKRINADITLQRNKRAIQKLSRGAKGSFFRNQLKKLRSDVEDLQKNIFRQKRVKDALQFKTELIAKKSIKEIQKISEDFARKRTLEKGEELEEITGESKESLKKFVDDFGNKFEKAVKIAKEKGQKGEIESNKIIKKETNTLLEKFKKLPKLKRALIGGIISGIFQEIIEKTLGFRVPLRLLGLLTPGGILVRAGAGTISSIFSRILKDVIDRNQAEKFRKILQTKNAIIIGKERRKLKEKFSPKRIKKIENLAKAA